MPVQTAKVKYSKKRPLAPFNVGSFPLYVEQVKKLIRSHRKLKDNPLHLAVWFDTDDPKDINLLEVVGGFPPNEDPGELFETQFYSSNEFIIAGEGVLRLTLASPDEMRSAIEEQYAIVQQIQDAFCRGAATAPYCSKEAQDILSKLKERG